MEKGADRSPPPRTKPSSLLFADEKSSDNGTRSVFDRHISSIVSLAEDGRVSVIRFALVEFCKCGAICGQGSSFRAGTVFLLYGRGHSDELVPALHEDRSHAAEL